MTNTKVVTPLLFKLLNTMKEEENSSFSIVPDYIKEFDPELTFKHTDDTIKGADIIYDDSKPLVVDLEVHKLNKVENVYNDGETFVKTIRFGLGTGQPYYDCTVVLKVSIEIDG